MPGVSEKALGIALRLNSALDEQGEITMGDALEAIAILTTSTIMGVVHDKERAEDVLMLVTELVRQQIRALAAKMNPAEVNH